MRGIQKSLTALLPFAFALTLVTGALSLPARADALSISAVGVLNVANVSGDAVAGNSFSSGTSIGFGALAGMSIMPGFSLELGALYVPRKVNLNDASGANLSVTSVKSLEIPLLLRFTALPIISVGAGPYYARGLSLSVTPNGGTEQTPDFGAINLNQSDFGLEGSIQASFPILPMLSITGDVRYLLGLSNTDSTGVSSRHYRDFELLAGITFGI